MKNITICLLYFLVVGMNTNAQMVDTSKIFTHKLDANSLIQKAKSQHTRGLILQVAGSLLVAAGSLIVMNDMANDVATNFGNSLFAEAPSKYSYNLAGPLSMLVGAGAITQGFFLLKASKKNKMRQVL